MSHRTHGILLVVCGLGVAADALLIGYLGAGPVALLAFPVGLGSAVLGAVQLADPK